MNGNWSTVKSKLDLFPDYQSAVFEQGYLITNRDIKMDDGFPYFGNWRKYQWNIMKDANKSLTERKEKNL